MSHSLTQSYTPGQLLAATYFSLQNWVSQRFCALTFRLFVSAPLSPAFFRLQFQSLLRDSALLSKFTNNIRRLSAAGFISLGMSSILQCWSLPVSWSSPWLSWISLGFLLPLLPLSSQLQNSSEVSPVSALKSEGFVSSTHWVYHHLCYLSPDIWTYITNYLLDGYFHFRQLTPAQHNFNLAHLLPPETFCFLLVCLGEWLS